MKKIVIMSLACIALSGFCRAEDNAQVSEKVLAEQKIQQVAVMVKKLQDTKISIDYKDKTLKEIAVDLSGKLKVFVIVSASEELGNAKITVSLKDLFIVDALEWIAKSANAGFDVTSSGVCFRDKNANEILDEKISLKEAAVKANKVLEKLQKNGVHFVATEDVMDWDAEISINVKDMPLREVIKAVAFTAGIDCDISSSGIVSLRINPRIKQEAEEAARREKMMERFRQFAPPGGMGGGDDNRRDRRRRRPRNDRNDNNEGGEAKGADGDNVKDGGADAAKPNKDEIF